MRVVLLTALFTVLAALSACTVTPNRYVTVQEQYCNSHPEICNARITHVYPTLLLPDLTVDPPKCEAVFGGYGIRATIRNLGPVSVPGPIDLSSTVFAGTTRPQPYYTNTGSVGLAAAGDAQRRDIISEAYFGPINADVSIPTVFEVYINPPEPPNYPDGKIFESNLQNNAACAVCHCDASGCSTQPVGISVCGGP